MTQSRPRSEASSPASLEQLLARIEAMEAGERRVSVEEVIEAVGRRSFGPLLLLAGLITLAPVIGDFPGVPTLMAALVLLVAVQLLAGRQHFWLPRWLLRRRLSRARFDQALGWMHRPARGIDRWLKARLTWLTGPWGTRGIAVICVAIALAMPPMEVIPFSANGAGLALTGFGLALMARDGVVALVAGGVTLGTSGLVLANLL